MGEFAVFWSIRQFNLRSGSVLASLLLGSLSNYDGDGSENVTKQ